MPTVAVNKYDLFEELGERFTSDSFQDLCFEFGLELDDDTEEDPLRPKDEPPQLKIEVPANRYDLLCIEGIAMQLNIFRGRTSAPNLRLLPVPVEKMQTITATKEVGSVRPYVAGAILRNMKFTPAIYESFISLQDKLHQSLGRNRTLVSIGTHDLDTIEGPFLYTAQPPKDISFVPLNQTEKMDGEALMTRLEGEKHLKKYLHIIRDKPAYPVIYDANRVVCSLPPIINGAHSRITLETRNVFIEITATDQTKLDITCNIIVAMFSRYCAEEFTIEPVKILYPDGTTKITPSLTSRSVEVEVDYLNQCCGLSESPAALCNLLGRMAFKAQPSRDNFIEVSIPPVRPDVLHPCDVMEDVAIAYGYNNLPRSAPGKSATIGQPLMINKLGDIVRNECAMSGWLEVMPLILCSWEENFAWLNRNDDGTAVKLANPKTVEYQVVRTSLLPGLLKTIRENKSKRLPLKVTEVSDVVKKDDASERKARNERHWAVAYSGHTSGLEIVHGTLDRVMSMLRIPYIDHEALGDAKARDGYFLEEIKEPTFFEGRAASVNLLLGGKARRIGEFGVIHPTVLENFGLKNPVTTLEVNIEVFL